MKKIFYVAITLLFSLSATYAATGFREDFNGASPNPGWAPDATYAISQSNGAMRINVNKSEGWKGLWLSLGGSYNFSAKPYANLKIRAPKGMTIDIYLANSTKNKNVMTRVIGTGESERFNTYFFDFTGAEAALLSDVTGIIIAVNGRAMTYSGSLWIDDLVIGDEALKLADIACVPDQKYYAGASDVKIQLTDIKNTASIQVSGGSGVISNTSVSAINSGTAILSFNVKDVTATETITLTAKAASSYVDKTTQFDISVEQNLPPTADMLPSIDLPAGIPQTVVLTGISDGNSTVEQKVTVSFGTLPEGITDASIKYNNGDSRAYITFTATPGTHQIPIQLSDDGGVNNTASTTITVKAYNNFNYPPDFTVNNAEVLFSTVGATTNIPITDVTDGNGGDNFSSITAVSSDETVADNITVESVLGQPTQRYLKVRIMKVGVAEITVTFTDNNGNGSNNGNLSTTKKIKLEVLAVPVTGCIIDLNNFSQEYAAGKHYFEGQNVEPPTWIASVVDSTGFKSLLNDFRGKNTWDGWWYSPPEMNLTEHPYMSYEVFPLDDNMVTHAYFYDNNNDRNDNGAHSERKTCPKGQWTRVFLDFRDPVNQTQGSEQKAINMSRITGLLFNIHTELGWPFTRITSRVLIRNIQVGSSVQNVPLITPETTIDPIGTQTYYAGSGTHSVTLTGITDGGEGTNTPTVTVSATGTNHLTGLTGNPFVNEQGEAVVSFTVSGSANTTALQVKVSASGSKDKTITFNVTTIDASTSGAVSVTLDPATKGQIIAGLGSNPDAHDIDRFVNDWGGSTVRLFPVGDVIEAKNDNSSPFSLDRSKISREGLRTEYIKQLSAAGVKHIFLTLLSPPAWMKENLSTDYFMALAPNYNETDNKVPEHLYDEYVEFLVACVEVIKEEAGIELAGLCIQNEPGFCEPYGSAILDPAHAMTMHKMVGRRFAELGIKTKLIFCETPWGWCQQWADALETDAEADAYTDVFGIHYPNVTSDWVTFNNTLKRGHPQEIWGAECETVGDDWNKSMDEVNKVITGFNNNLTLWCTYGFSGKNAMLSGSTATKHYYAFKNINRYVRPGDRQIKSTCSNSNVKVAAFECEPEYRITLLLANVSTSAAYKITMPAQVKNKYTIYRSSDNEKCIEVNKADAVKDNMLILPARSITTVVVDTRDLHMTQPANMTIAYNATAQEVTLEGISYDGRTDETISVMAVSDKTDLIPNPTVDYTSPEATAKLHFTPVTGKHGEVKITVALSVDGGLTNKEYSFNVTVKGPNKAPVMTQPNDVVVAYNASEQTVNLSGINDGDDGSQTITITATSSNTALVPNPTVVYTSGANGSLKFTPVADMSGETIITVTLKDNGGTTGGGVDTKVYTFKITVSEKPYINSAPTMDDISDITVEYNSGLRTVNLTGINDNNDGTQTVTITAVSSNKTLIPDPAVTYTSPNTTGSLGFTPVSGKSGEAIITVTVTDNGGTENGGADRNIYTFKVTVNEKPYVNIAPVMDPLPDRTVDYGPGNYTVNLSGIDDGNPERAQTISILAESSNTELIAELSVDYTSPNTTGILNFSPAADKSGESTITVTVSDDGGVENGGSDRTVYTFKITVKEINKVPVMDQPENLTLPYNSGQQKVQLTGIGDGNDGTQEITITATSSNTAIIPNPAVDYTWPSSTGELTFTPVADKSGKVTVTVTLTDNGGTAGGGVNNKKYSFTVTIDPIGIEDVRQENALYPNPATKEIRLDVPFADAGWKYVVMNTAGVTVKNGDVPVDNEGLSIDVSDLIPGWYLLQVTNGKEMVSQPFQKR